MERKRYDLNFKKMVVSKGSAGDQQEESLPAVQADTCLASAAEAQGQASEETRE
ncbi:hypothetical protein [Paenibacillus ottowii]|uniref:hypothetical protein n=1 Tax=Paenibacillus ottowii TaxID=2315729 RepID=UPI00138FF8D8|nr:hypothetical protein [Paenibacillus ottowii]NEU29085.1 hypothetical protein [Paenibacillus polymyxa]